MNQKKLKEDWEMEFEKRFANFPGSAHWFVEVREFIRRYLSKEREKIIKEIIKKGRELMLTKEELKLAEEIGFNANTNLDGFLNVLENALGYKVKDT